MRGGPPSVAARRDGPADVPARGGPAVSRRGRIEGKERAGGVVGEGWWVRGCARQGFFICVALQQVQLHGALPRRARACWISLVI